MLSASARQVDSLSFRQEECAIVSLQFLGHAALGGTAQGRTLVPSGRLDHCVHTAELLQEHTPPSQAKESITEIGPTFTAWVSFAELCQ